MKKVIWITGGGTGIGKAVAIKFANQGWNVAISGRRENILKEVEGTNPNIKSFPLDVNDKGKCFEIMNNIKDEFGDIDICFFSTGTWDPKKEKEIDVEQIENVFKVNFFGTLNCIKAVEDHFRNRKNGIITIVSSIAGYKGLPDSTGYGPSKAALNNLAESLYFDFGRYGVRVCLVSPGFIKTPMTDKLSEDQQNQILKNIPASRFGLPSDVASACIYLSSDEASFVTGSTIHVNGGMGMF